MNNFKAKNIILNLDGTTDLPYKTTNDVILKDNQSVNYGFNNAVQQLADNDMYIRHVLREQQQYQAGPTRLTNESLSKTIDNYKYLNIEDNELSILQKHNYPISATMKQIIGNKSVKKLFNDGKYYMLADDGLYAAVELSDLGRQKIVDIAGSQLCAVVYDVDSHTLMYSGSGQIKGKIGIITGFIYEEIVHQTFVAKCGNAAINETITSMEYDNKDDTLYIGTTVSDSVGRLYMSQGRQIDAAGTSMQFNLVQPINKPVLTICKLSGDSTNKKILAGTFGDGLYESTNEYQFVDLIDVAAMPSGYTATCLCKLEDKTIVGTDKGILVFNGAQYTVKLSSKAIRNAKVFNDMCFVAASDGLYVMKYNQTDFSKLLAGSIVDVCVLENGIIAAAKDKGLYIAKSVDSPTFTQVDDLSNTALLSIAKLNDAFYAASSGAIYKVSVQFVKSQRTDKSLVSYKNSSNKTFQQICGTSARINKAATIGNEVYLLTTVGLYDTNFNLKYNIAKSVNNIRKCNDYLLVSTANGLAIVKNNQTYWQFTSNEVYDAFFDGKIIYAAVKSGNATAVAAIDESAIISTKANAEPIKRYDGQNISVSGACISMAVVDNTIYIIANGSLKYINVKIQTSKIGKSSLFNTGSKLVSEFKYATNVNFSYDNDIAANSQYVRLTTTNGGVNADEIYQLNENGEFRLVTSPGSVLPKMAIGQASNLSAYSLINVGIGEKNTMFTSSVDRKTVYNFEQSNVKFGEVNFTTAGALKNSKDVSKIIYQSDVNCIADLTIDNITEEYAAENKGGKMFLVGTKSHGLYLHYPIVNQKTLSTLINCVTPNDPLGNLSCLAVAEYTSTTINKTDESSGQQSIRRAKELIYFASSGTSLYYACTIDANDHSKNDKYKYADFKHVTGTKPSGRINKLLFQYNGNTPIGCFIAATDGLYYADLKYYSYDAGLIVQIPQYTIVKLDSNKVTVDGARTTLTNITDVSIAHGLVFVIANNGIMFYGTLATNTLDLQLYRVIPTSSATTLMNSLKSMQLVEVPAKGGDTKIIGLCITTDNKHLMSLKIEFDAYGPVCSMREVQAQTTKVDGVNTSSGIFTQPVLLQNCANQIVLATKFTLSGKNYIAHIRAYDDKWHLVRVNNDNDSGSTYSSVTLNMHNLYDAATGNIVGCIIQHAGVLYNTTNQIEINMSEYDDTTESRLEISDLAREILASNLRSSTTVNTEWFAVCGEDTSTVEEGNEIKDSYMLDGVLNGNTVMFRSSIITELTNPSEYNILQNANIQEINVTDLVSPKKNHVNIVTVCTGKTVIVMQQYSAVLQELFRIVDTNNVVHACVDAEHYVLLYSTRNGNTDYLKYVNLDVDDITSTLLDGTENSYISVHRDGNPSEIDLSIAGKVIGMFSSNSKAYMVCTNGVYSLENIVVAMASPAIVDRYIDTYGPLSLTENNSELILLTQTRGEMKKYTSMQFNVINDRYDTFAVQDGGTVHAVSDGKIYTRTAKVDAETEFVHYSYEIVDDAFRSATALACFSNGNICLVAANDIKVISNQVVNVEESNKLADLRVSNGATNLIESSGAIIAYGKENLLILDDDTCLQGNVGFNPDIIAHIHNGYLLHNKSTNELRYTKDLVSGNADRVYILDSLVQQFVNATNSYVLLKDKLMSYEQLGRNLYFNHVDGSQYVVQDICRVNDNEALLMQYADKNNISLYWLKNGMMIKNQTLRNIGKAKIVDLHAVDSTTYDNLYAVLCQSGKVYVSQNNKFTKWQLLFNMHDSKIANGRAVSAQLFDMLMLTQFQYVVATSNGAFCTEYKYTLTNNYSKTTQYDVNMAILSCCQNMLVSHVNTMHSNNTAAGKFINTINNDLMPNDFSEIDPTWQKINNECTIIENDVVEHVEFGAANMHVSAMYTNAQDLSNWTNSTDLTYIDKQYKSNIHELYIYLPTTGTNYIPLPIFSDSINALSGQVKNNATHIRVLLDPEHYDLQEMMEVQINGNSFPLGMTQTEEQYGDEGKMFHSCILPSIAKFAPLKNDVSASNIQMLSGMYMFEFQCFGSDAQAIKIMFKQKNKYSVQFKAGYEANGYMDDQVFTVGETQNLNKNKYVVDGSLFRRWVYEDFDGTTKTFGDEAEIKSTFDSNNKSFTNNNGVKVQLSAEFSEYTFSSADTEIKLNSSLAYISNAQPYAYGVDKMHGVVVDFGA